MAPEQTRGSREGVTVAADVYSIGAIMYAVLTARAPFVGAFPLDTIRQVQERETAPPRAINPKVDRDLEIICLKCLQKEPQRRYGSALALAEDLERWLAGGSIAARPMGTVERGWRWCRRNPMAASLVAMIFLVVVTASWMTRSTRSAKKPRLCARLRSNWTWHGKRSNRAGGHEPMRLLDGPAGSWRRQARRPVTGLAARLAELQFMFRLEDIRMNHLEAKDDGLGLVRAASLYNAAFHDYGIDVEAGDPTDIAKRLKGPDVLRSALVAALDVWALNTTDDAHRGRLLALADRAADQPGSLASRVRRALTEADKTALLRLAAEARVAEQKPSTLVSLATGLRERGALEEAAALA